MWLSHPRRRDSTAFATRIEAILSGLLDWIGQHFKAVQTNTVNPFAKLCLQRNESPTLNSIYAYRQIYYVQRKGFRPQIQKEIGTFIQLIT